MYLRSGNFPIYSQNPSNLFFDKFITAIVVTIGKYFLFCPFTMFLVILFYSTDHHAHSHIPELNLVKRRQ